MTRKSAGFGTPATERDHQFMVSLPRSRKEPAVLTEYGKDTRRPLVRARLPRRHWYKIAPVVAKEFNRRLKKVKRRVGRWQIGDTGLDHLLGKELCVLMWAAENAELDEVETIVERWLALRPEERWWLYSMAATQVDIATGHGWRYALYVALSEPPRREAPARPVEGAAV